jgi:hypothetical protein
LPSTARSPRSSTPTLKTQRHERRGDDRGDVDVEVRSLALYDELIA